MSTPEPPISAKTLKAAGHVQAGSPVVRQEVHWPKSSPQRVLIEGMDETHTPYADNADVSLHFKVMGRCEDNMWRVLHSSQMMRFLNPANVCATRLLSVEVTAYPRGKNVRNWFPVKLCSDRGEACIQTSKRCGQDVLSPPLYTNSTLTLQLRIHPQTASCKRSLSNTTLFFYLFLLDFVATLRLI